MKERVGYIVWDVSLCPYQVAKKKVFPRAVTRQSHVQQGRPSMQHPIGDRDTCWSPLELRPTALIVRRHSSLLADLEGCLASNAA